MGSLPENLYVVKWNNYFQSERWNLLADGTTFSEVPLIWEIFKRNELKELVSFFHPPFEISERLYGE